MRQQTRGYVYALLTAAAFAWVPVLARVGLRGAHTLTGVTLAVWSGTALVGLGLLLANYASLVHIPVVLSAPITATYPAFALVFAFLLQRRTQAITRRVLVGTLAIVAGGAMLVW